MTTSLESIDGKFEFSIDLVPLYLKLAVLVIMMVVALNFYNGIPVIEICNGLMECIKGRTRTNNEVVEPGQYRVSSIRSIVGCEVKVNSEGLLIINPPNQ